jgi:A/G-specific adenine glycosylase
MPNLPAYHDDAAALLAWYKHQKRALPWRRDRDPYKIWISEVMLQQTTVAAVIPFFERFILRFETVDSLASASIADVYEHWSGLGYYSRARNLHKSAQVLSETGFPRTHEKLEELPGFGPYTARAVASIAFDEKVGVLDGNVIRILCRMYDQDLEWWKPQARKTLQVVADHLAQVDEPSELNQAMMELGATVCTPHSPACLLCPWAAKCQARANDTILLRPRKRPRKAIEAWVWKPMIIEKNGKLALIKNTYAPFLKNQLMWPGSVTRTESAPKKFDGRGGVTHYDIFISVAEADAAILVGKDVQWVARADLKRVVPVSLMHKALAAAEKIKHDD